VGLRLVELAKEDLGELPAVLEALRGRCPRFILFVDDLSFEEHEVEYKALKALLEGSSRSRPGMSGSTPPPTAATSSANASPTAKKETTFTNATPCRRSSPW
jgi:hypothetical protein